MVASPLLRISEWNATLRSRKNDIFPVLSEFISPTNAYRITDIISLTVGCVVGGLKSDFPRKR